MAIFLADPSSTSAPHQLAVANGFAKEMQWSPDGKRLSFLYVEGATRPSGALAAEKPPSGVIGVEGLEVQRVAAVDATSGQLTQITPPKLHVFEFDWSPDSKKLAYVAAPPPGENNWWVAKLYTQPRRWGADRHSRSADSSRVAARVADRRAPLVAGWPADRLHRRPDVRPGVDGWRHLRDAGGRRRAKGHDAGSRGHPSLVCLARRQADGNLGDQETGLRICSSTTSRRMRSRRSTT